MLNQDAPARVMLTTDTVGGVWHYCLELAHGFAARGAAVTIAVMGPPASESQRAEAGACGAALLQTALPLDWLASGPDELQAAARELASLAVRLDSDTVQLHTPAFAAGADWQVPVIAMAHSCVGTWWRAVRRNAVLPADLAWRAACVVRGLVASNAVIAPSQAFATALRETYGAQCTVLAIPNGRHTVPLPRDPQPRALAAGRLWDEGKNIAVLDAAAAALEYPVRAAGPVHGPNGAHVVCHHLHLLGTLDDATLAREYAQASVFVSPARYEPFGLAVLEAAQAGVALVLSDIPTFRELWNGAAVFVPPDDSASLTMALRRLLESPRRCAALGEAAHARAAGYTAERMIDSTWNVHCNLWRAQTTARTRCAA